MKIRNSSKLQLDALNKTIELWEWLAKTGFMKLTYFRKHLNKRPVPMSRCFLCQINKSHCYKCILTDSALAGKRISNENCNNEYFNWVEQTTKNNRKKYAQYFVDYLKMIKSNLLASES